MATILAFHAHPDDESVSTGVTLAKYADEGHRVVVVTATDGSAGEIHNYENPEELFPKLAEIRKEELEKSLDALGVKEFEWLGYKDSGMMGTGKTMILIVFGDKTILDLWASLGQK